MNLCKWCGIDLAHHTPGQIEAAEEMLKLLPHLAYNKPYEQAKKEHTKISKVDQ